MAHRQGGPWEINYSTSSSGQHENKWRVHPPQVLVKTLNEQLKWKVSESEKEKEYFLEIKSMKSSSTEILYKTQCKKTDEFLTLVVMPGHGVGWPWKGKN